MATIAAAIASHIGRPMPGCKHPGHVGAHHGDGALREIGGARGLVDQHDAERDEAVHRADKRSGQCELPEQFDIHG